MAYPGRRYYVKSRVYDRSDDDDGYLTQPSSRFLAPNNFQQINHGAQNIQTRVRYNILTFFL